MRQWRVHSTHTCSPLYAGLSSDRSRVPPTGQPRQNKDTNSGPRPWVIIAVVVTIATVRVAVNFTTDEKNIQHRVMRMYSVDSPQFVLELSSLLGPPLVEGNRVTALFNGDEISPAMLDAINGVQKTINFKSYIYWSGAIGK